MYTEADRLILLGKIEEKAKASEAVQGLLLVGSGAYGFRDAYSDLDVVLVVEDSEKVPPVHDEWVHFVKERCSVLRHKEYRHEEDIYVSCFLFADGMELDLGIWSFAKLRATKRHWKVLVDRNVPQIQERLELTLPIYHRDATAVANESLSSLWQFVREAAVAIARGHALRAVQEIEVIRSKAVELIAIREGIPADFHKEIGNYRSSPRVVKLVETYEGSMDRSGLEKMLMAVLQLYFEEVAVVLGIDEASGEHRVMIRLIENIVGEPRMKLDV
ncbi:aminoglycoside 6-adenylyltransferase [Gorillibacterium sp. CAU 1737]|uniref:aminoglycoside 6-adenylyltransferase n=1 Tax=Gorillibacterium sp. CAU 1737 TaxID=3140362 RepID=UPI003260080A